MSRRTSSAFPVHIALAMGAALVLLPIIWTVAAGFRTQISLLMGDVLFTPIGSNFAEVLWSKTSDFLLNYRNSIIVGVLSTVLCVGVATRVSACVGAGRAIAGAMASARSTLAAYSDVSENASGCSPGSASTWNSCEALPPIAPVSACTARNFNSRRVKMRV